MLGGEMFSVVFKYEKLQWRPGTLLYDSSTNKLDRLLQAVTHAMV